MSRIAIIGAGIAGVGTARFLHRAGHDLTLFEQAHHLGGHADTTDVADTPATAEQAARRLPVDTGFMVFNRDAHPLLGRLFDELQVPLRQIESSLSVRDDATGLEFRGPSLGQRFAQRKNLVSVRFWRLLAQIRRFNRETASNADLSGPADESLGDHLSRLGYGRDFFDLHLAPLAYAVWNTPPQLLPTLPAPPLLDVLRQHGLIGPRSLHPWWMVDGGSREYLRRLVAPFRERILVGCTVTRIVRHGSGQGVTVLTDNGASRRFDQVVIATHADQALRLVVNPTPAEVELLGAFRYQTDTVTLHTDARVLPSAPGARAAWNYRIHRDDLGQPQPALHCHVNALQPLDGDRDLFVSINGADHIDPAKTLETKTGERPLFDLAAVRARRRLPELNTAATGATETYYAGGYFGHGLHEDALASAARLAELLLGRNPWTTA